MMGADRTISGHINPRWVGIGGHLLCGGVHLLLRDLGYCHFLTYCSPGSLPGFLEKLMRRWSPACHTEKWQCHVPVTLVVLAPPFRGQEGNVGAGQLWLMYSSEVVHGRLKESCLSQSGGSSSGYWSPFHQNMWFCPYCFRSRGEIFDELSYYANIKSYEEFVRMSSTEPYEVHDQEIIIKFGDNYQLWR